MPPVFLERTSEYDEIFDAWLSEDDQLCIAGATTLRSSDLKSMDTNSLPQILSYPLPRDEGRLIQLVAQPAAMEVEFLGAPEQLYTLESTATLTNTNWVEIGNMLTGEDGRVVMPLLDAGSNAGFFRGKKL